MIFSQQVAEHIHGPLVYDLPKTWQLLDPLLLSQGWRNMICIFNPCVNWLSISTSLWSLSTSRNKDSPFFFSYASFHFGTLIFLILTGMINWSGLLGSFAPCVLYGSNVERLGLGPGTFANHCLPYSGLYLLGNSLFGWNCMAPCFSYPSRTAIRRKFNLEASIGYLVTLPC